MVHAGVGTAVPMGVKVAVGPPQGVYWKVTVPLLMLQKYDPVQETAVPLQEHVVHVAIAGEGVHKPGVPKTHARVKNTHNRTLPLLTFPLLFATKYGRPETGTDCSLPERPFFDARKKPPERIQIMGTDQLPPFITMYNSIWPSGVRCHFSLHHILTFTPM